MIKKEYAYLGASRGKIIRRANAPNNSLAYSRPGEVAGNPAEVIKGIEDLEYPFKTSERPYKRINEKGY